MACSLRKLDIPVDLEIKDVVERNKRLGKGSYGKVVEVTWDGKVCAGKKLHNLLEADDQDSPDENESANRSPVFLFKRECEIWSRLQNTHIVEFFGLYYYQKDKLPMIVMEKMDISLDSYLSIDRAEIERRVSNQRKVQVLHQVILGLVYLHTHKPLVVHRDLTPKNILIRFVDEKSITAKLSDFGGGKMLNRYEEKMTKVPGTMSYMPPEVFDKGDPVPGYHDRIDVFSLGCVIISVFTGKTPTPMNTNDTEYEKREGYIKMIPNDAQKFSPLIERCLQDKPADRPHIRELEKDVFVMLQKPIENAFIVIEKEVHVAFASSNFRKAPKYISKWRGGATVAALYKYQHNSKKPLTFIKFGKEAVSHYEAEKDSDCSLVLFKEYFTKLEDIRYNVPSCSSDAITIPVVELIADTFGYIRLVSRFESNSWYVILAGNHHPEIFSDVAEKANFANLTELSLSQCAIAGKTMNLWNFPSMSEAVFITVNFQGNEVVVEQCISHPNLPITRKSDIVLQISKKTKLSSLSCLDYNVSSMESLTSQVSEIIRNMINMDCVLQQDILVGCDMETCLCLSHLEHLFDGKISILTCLHDEVICGGLMLISES